MGNKDKKKEVKKPKEDKEKKKEKKAAKVTATSNKAYREIRTAKLSHKRIPYEARMELFDAGGATFSDRARLARQYRGLTQMELAQKIYGPAALRENIAKLENPRITKGGTLNAVSKLAKALNISKSWLAFGEGFIETF